MEIFLTSTGCLQLNLLLMKINPLQNNNNNNNNKIGFPRQLLSSDIPFMTAILGFYSWFSRDTTPEITAAMFPKPIISISQVCH